MITVHCIIHILCVHEMIAIMYCSITVYEYVIYFIYLHINILYNLVDINCVI